MPSQVGPVCYPSALAAATAQASSMGGSIVQQGTASYVVEVGVVAANSITYVYRPILTGTAFQSTSWYYPQECQMLDWTDGLALGWLVAGIWLATAGLLFLTRALKGDHDGNS